MGFHPRVVVFDVNETLSDMAPLAGRFTEVGAPATLMPTWFAALLRDGFALTAAGANPAFAEVGSEVLRGLLTTVDGLGRDVDDAVAHVMAGFAELDVHPDVAEGLRTMTDAGLRLVTLSNGAASVAEGLLGRAGLTDLFEAFLSAADAPAWKPAPAAYAYAAERCGTAPDRMLLVASHPWDIDGAKRAGLRAAWLDRQGVPYPAHFTEPDVVGQTLDDIAVAASGSPS